MIVRYIVSLEDQKSVMIKEYLSDKLPSALLSFINKQETRFLVNDQNVYNYYLLNDKDILEVIIPADIINKDIKVVNKEFEILYEDSYLLIINKQPNLACIPTKRHFESSLANYVLAYYKRKGIASGIHFVNRLDYATSGIVVLAKDTYTTTLMKDAITSKKYLLLVENNIYEDGIIETGIVKDENSVILRKITTEYINSKTEYKVLKNGEKQALIEAILHTGKTHQLRLHFKSINHPIIGDKLYGNSVDNNLRLHSYQLEFTHPISKEKITITSYPDWNDDLYLEFHQ